MNKFICALILSATAAIAAAAPATPPARAVMPYAMADTAVHQVASKELKRTYEIAVSLPEGYKTSTRRYPVVFVSDANYAFPLVRSLSKRVGDGGRGLEDFILVGLGYSQGDSPTFARRRDYTPGQPAETDLKPDESGRAPQFGQAEAYRRFIASEVFPLIAQRYRADMARKVFVGHSYGSLLGLHILFTDSAMFDQYIMGSPSLWYGKQHMFEREKAYAEKHRDLKARIFFAVGGQEMPSPEHPERSDMVGELKRFENILRARQYPGLRIHSRVFDGEDHLTVAPAILTHGLKWTLPARK
ncbi:alpha/beta hydrolase [Massilia sp. PAMC28688]|uniref:alpha/beta hydrolase n=1 Tax=Massilia sp. PAMC28688 TaxID=2861283 RepID=UPI001E447B09|nr:alpha/beta hydrolase-fold protein [Massilia sp. PAMC28688]